MATEYAEIFLYKLQRKVSGASDSTFQDVTPATYSVSGSAAYGTHPIQVYRENSERCGYTEPQPTQYRWYASGTVCSACSSDDRTYVRYINSGTTAIGGCTYNRQRQQTSTDGGNTWTSTAVYTVGSLISCPYKARLGVMGSGALDIPCDGSPVLTRYEVISTAGAITNVQAVTMSNGCLVPPRSIGAGAFSGATALTQVVLTSNITTIDTNAFNGCPSLTSIELPASITEIASKAFANNHNMVQMTINAEVPPTLAADAFDDNYLPYSGILYVPSSAVAAYMAADGWKEFSDIRAIS